MSAACTKTKVSVITDDEEKRVKVLQRAQWLRAAILGANDGLLSTTSLMLGVGAAKEDQRLMIISGLAGALAGSCSMAVGEFVSVSTQREIEKTGSIHKSNSEPQEVEGPLSASSKNLSQASQNTSPHIFIEVEALNDDHIMEEALPNPYKAAGASGLAFLCGSLVPLVSAMMFSGYKTRVVGIVVVASVALAMFGGAGARLGGSPVRVSAMRVLLGGWISMAVTYGLLKALDTDHKGQETD